MLLLWVRVAVILLLLSALAFCGCTRRYPNDLTWQLAGADQVIVKEWYHGSILVLREQQAAEIIRAVSAAKGLPKNVSTATAPCCEIQFLRGTNVLAKILVQEEWFATKDGEYTDSSGTLKALQRRLEYDPLAWQAWVLYLAQEVLHRPECTNLQTWSVATLKRYDLGELRTKGSDERKAVDHRELPQWLEGTVRAANLFMPEVYVRESPSGRGECIELSWEKFGLLVGRSNFTTAFQPWYITNAAPGIYVFHDREEMEQ